MASIYDGVVASPNIVVNGMTYFFIYPVELVCINQIRQDRLIVAMIEAIRSGWKADFVAKRKCFPIMNEVL